MHAQGGRVERRAGTKRGRARPAECACQRHVGDLRGHPAGRPAPDGVTTRAGRFAARRGLRGLRGWRSGMPRRLARLSERTRPDGMPGRSAAPPSGRRRLLRCAGTRAVRSHRRLEGDAGLARRAPRRRVAAGGWRPGVGRRPGWHGGGRVPGPYLRDELLNRGLLVETLETDTDWSKSRRYTARSRWALRGRLASAASWWPGLDLYRPGRRCTSPSWLRRPTTPPDSGRAKTRRRTAIVEGRGTITHTTPWGTTR